MANVMRCVTASTWSSTGTRKWWFDTCQTFWPHYKSEFISSLCNLCFEAMWCLSAGTGRLTFTQWVQRKRLLFVSYILRNHSSSAASIPETNWIPFAFVYVITSRTPSCNSSRPCLEFHYKTRRRSSLSRSGLNWFQCANRMFFHLQSSCYSIKTKLICYQCLVVLSGRSWGPSSCSEAAAFMAGRSGDTWTEDSLDNSMFRQLRVLRGLMGFDSQEKMSEVEISDGFTCYS